MVTYADALKKLEELDGGAEFAEAVKGELTKKNNEAQNLRTAKKAIEDKVKAVYGVFDLSDSASPEDIKEALEAKISEASKSPDNPELKQLQKQMQKLTGELDTWKQNASQEKQKRIEAITTQSIQDALVANKAIKPGVLVNVLKNSVKVGDDEGLVFVAADGSEVSINDGIKGWLESNPEFVLSEQRPGSGGSADGGHASYAYSSVENMDVGAYAAARKEGKIT